MVADPADCPVAGCPGRGGGTAAALVSRVLSFFGEDGIWPQPGGGACRPYAPFFRKADCPDNLGKVCFLVDALAVGVSSKRFSRLAIFHNRFIVKLLH